MAKPRKTKAERQNEVIRTVLSEIADSYIFIGILPESSIVVLERSKDLVQSITLDTILERLNRLKETKDELREIGGDLLGNDESEI